MFSWRITKYNPENRDFEGNYLDTKEWTSYSEINKAVDNNAITYQQYLSIEDAYIASIILFMQCNKLKTICINGLEKNHRLLDDDPYISEKMKTIYDAIKNKIDYDTNTVSIIARLVLREKVWCKFEAKSMFVHF